tara:strand:- start:1600 stop:3129 length:1530 start_codon:yes stop_codon:yes gene_type:complete
MNLIKSTGTFSIFIIISRVLGYLRDVLIATYLGSGPIADAFFVAFRIPNTFRRLFAEGSFNAAFVPSYSSELLKGKSKATKFANDAVNFLMLGLLFIVIIIEILMPGFVYLIAPGFYEDKSKLELTTLLTRITFPFLLFISLASFFSAILNSHNKFGIAAASPIILNIILILIVFFEKKSNIQLAIYLSYGVSFAGLLQLVFVYFFAKKYFSPKFNFRLKITNKIKVFFSKFLPGIFSSGVTQINILVGTIIASFQASAVSYLYYADRIYQINLAIAGIAIGTVILPNLSRYIKTRDIKKINFIQNKSFELCLFLSVPATMALLVGSEEITSALFGYGAFDSASVSNSAKALYYFALGLPAFAIIKVFSTFLFARDDTKTPFYYSLISVMINIIISVYFFNDIGFIIIAIATTVSSWANALLLFFKLSSNGYFKLSSIFNIPNSKIILVSSVSIYAFKFLIDLFNENLIYESQFKFLTIILLVVITILIYILISILTKTFKYSDIKLKY